MSPISQNNSFQTIEDSVKTHAAPKTNRYKPTNDILPHNKDDFKFESYEAEFALYALKQQKHACILNFYKMCALEQQPRDVLEWSYLFFCGLSRFMDQNCITSPSANGGFSDKCRNCSRYGDLGNEVCSKDERGTQSELTFVGTMLMVVSTTASQFGSKIVNKFYNGVNNCLLREADSSLVLYMFSHISHKHVRNVKLENGYITMC